MSGRVQYDSNADRVTDYWVWGIAEHGDKFEVIADVSDSDTVELVSRERSREREKERNKDRE